MFLSAKLKFITVVYLILLNIIFSKQGFCATPDNNIIILNTTGKPPLNNEQMQGFMDQVALEAFRRIGLTLKTVSLPAERALLNANKLRIDGEMSRIADLQYKYSNLVQVPEKIMDWEFVAIGKPELNSELGWRSLAGKRVAFINGWKILEENITPVTEVKKVKGSESLFRLLLNKRVDFVIYERWAGAKYIKDLSLNHVTINLPALAKRKMFIYLNKKHAPLVNELVVALRNMKADGTYSQIEEKILKQYSDH